MKKWIWIDPSVILAVHDEQIAEIIEAIRQLLAAPATPTKPKQIGFQVRERRAKYTTR